MRHRARWLPLVVAAFAGCSSHTATLDGSAGLDSGKLTDAGDVDAGMVDASTGFVTRPYLFQPERARLLASIAAGDPEATGPAANNPGTPVGFISLCRAALADRVSYSDVPTWQLAFAGWLSSDTAMLDRARDETMAVVAAQPNGVTGTGDAFQHSETGMLNVAAVADLAYSRFTAAQLAQVATWVNGTLDNWNRQNVSYWPFDDARNNYWQNGFLAFTVAGICTEGFNSRAAGWRQQTETMAGKLKTAVSPPKWSGPLQSEGHYYSTYVSHALWAMTLYDRVVGTRFLADSGISATQTLDMVMYETRPSLINFFEVGSEPADSHAPFHATSLEYWHQLISLASGSNQAKHAKSILNIAMADAGNFWGRASKGFANFYWSLRPTTEAPLSTKLDRLFTGSTPGAGLIGARSSLGFQANALAALMFANRFDFTPGFSHGNPDAPGFQWAIGSDWLVVDPEYFSTSGILAEAGSGVYSDVSNIVTLAGQKYSASGAYPVITHAEDNRAQPASHFYVQIDAQPYWTAASVYRRDYVWLDDLRVVVIFDHVVSSAAKTWRLHAPAQPTIGGSAATYTINGNVVRIRDLFTTGAAAMTATDLLGTLTQQSCWQITQPDSSNDYRSLKVLDLGSRATSATLSSSAGSLTANLTINGAGRTVTFYDDGTHALVQ